MSIEALRDWGPLAGAVGTVLGAALIGVLLHALFWRVLSRFARETSSVLDDSLVRRCRRPTAFVLPVLALYVVLPLVHGELGEEGTAFVGNLLLVLLTFAVAWTLVRFTSVAQDVVASRYDVRTRDNLHARAIQTQFGIIRKIAILAVGVLALSTVLMSFEEFRQLGTGLLASAGLAGIVVGLAAQKTLGNLLAGIQIALTQPIRIDDVVVVEGEWGRIEEITLTYVVVRVWDLRRLILPIGYFLEKPFQNWTRISANILGTVTLMVDYRVPVDEIRAQLECIVRDSSDWDGNVCGVQVTDASDRGIEVRALVSADDSSKAWDLRCTVREKLIEFLQEHHPDSLPRVRAEIEKGSVRDATAAAP